MNHMSLLLVSMVACLTLLTGTNVIGMVSNIDPSKKIKLARVLTPEQENMAYRIADAIVHKKVNDIEGYFDTAFNRSDTDPRVQLKEIDPFYNLVAAILLERNFNLDYYMETGKGRNEAANLFRALYQSKKEELTTKVHQLEEQASR